VKKSLRQFVTALDLHFTKTIESEMGVETQAPISLSPKEKLLTIRASSVGVCRRFLWYVQEYGKPELAPEVQQRLYNGVILHRAMEEILHHMPGVKVLFMDDTNLQKKIIEVEGWTVWLTGTPDAVLEWKGKRIVVDFKGLSRWNIDAFEDSPLTRHYQDQANAYAVLTGSIGAVIAARSKETGQMKYAIQAVKPKQLQQWCWSLIEKIALIPENPPLRDYPMDSFFCRWCPFKQECWLLRKESLSEKPASIKGKTLDHLKAMARLVLQLHTLIQKAEAAESELKRQIINIHEQTGLKTLRCGDGHYTQIRNRTWKRLVMDQKTQRVLDAWYKQRVNRLLQKGKAQYVESESSYLVVR